jgi:hypothetical protein
LPTEFDVNVVLAGAGSVGGDVGCTFARVPRLGGAIDVVDPERLEPRNLIERCWPPRNSPRPGRSRLKCRGVIAHQLLVVRRYKDRFEQ